MKIKITKLLVLFLIVLPFSFINAQTMSYTPRVYATGLGGSSLMGRGDLLVPTYLGTNSNLFVYGMGRAARENNSSHDNSWTGSAGLGYRHVTGDAAMLGIYCLADYTNSPTQNYWVIGPGIEAIGRWLEFRANGYFPIDKKDWKTENFADKFGDYSKISFTGNSQYDHWYQYHEEIGIGGDADLGIKIAKIDGVLVKGFVNGYYFDIKHNDDVIGGGARLTIQPTNYAKIIAAYSYDKYEDSTFMAGIQLSLYDLFNSDRRHAKVDEQDLQQHLFDPLERQFGTLGSAKSVPIVRNDTPEDLGPRLEHDNIWFFKAGAAGNAVQGKGTYENPFRAFTTAEIDYVKANYQNVDATIDPYPLLYFNSGNYPLTAFGNRFTVPTNWGMYGWNSTIPATGAQRPVFIGGIDLTTGNNILDSIAIHNNNGAQDYGLDITTNNINLNNVEVGTLNNTSGYKTGIEIDDANNIILNQSQIYGFDAPATGNVAHATGIDITDSTLTIGNNNTISANAVGSAPADSSLSDIDIRAFAKGLKARDSTINLNGSRNTISAAATGTTIGNVSSPVFATMNGKGLEARDSTINLNGSGNTITAATTGGSAGDVSDTTHVDAFAQGLFLYNSIINLNGNGNTIAATAKGGSVRDVSNTAYARVSAAAEGINTHQSTINLNGNRNNILVTAKGGSARNVSDTASANVSAIADGFDTEDNSTINLNGNGNTVSTTAEGGTVENVSSTATADANANATSLAAANSTVNLTGSENTFTAAAEGGTVENVSGTATANANARGLNPTNSTMNLNGNGNTVTATAEGGIVKNISGAAEPDVDANATAYGLYAYKSIITLRGNGSNISATATGGSIASESIATTGKAYGINIATKSTLDIKNTATNTNITVNGSTYSYGIYAYPFPNAYLKRERTNIDEGTDYDDLVTYTNLNPLSAGYALQWGAIIKPW